MYIAADEIQDIEESTSYGLSKEQDKKLEETILDDFIQEVEELANVLSILLSKNSLEQIKIPSSVKAILIDTLYNTYIKGAQTR